MAAPSYRSTAHYEGRECTKVEEGRLGGVYWEEERRSPAHLGRVVGLLVGKFNLTKRGIQLLLR